MPTILGAFLLHFGGGGGLVGDLPRFARFWFFLDNLLGFVGIGSILGVMCIPTTMIFDFSRELSRMAIIRLLPPHLRLNFRAMFAQFRRVFSSSKVCWWFTHLTRFVMFKHTVWMPGPVSVKVTQLYRAKHTNFSVCDTLQSSVVDGIQASIRMITSLAQILGASI